MPKGASGRWWTDPLNPVCRIVYCMPHTWNPLRVGAGIWIQPNDVLDDMSPYVERSGLRSGVHLLFW